MSMNLAFEMSGLIIDFPFQLPTKLSYAVMKVQGTEARIKLLEKELKTWNWSKDDINARLAQCLAKCSTILI